MDNRDYLEDYSFTDIEAPPMIIGLMILVLIVALSIAAC